MTRTAFRFASQGFLSAVIFAAVAAVGFAQQRVPTTIQLPTFNFFAISTTVEVPDSGSATLGGVNSSAAGANGGGFGGLPFGSMATGSTTSGGSMSVTATIHDFDAMDRKLLAEGARQPAAVTAQERARQSLPAPLQFAQTRTESDRQAAPANNTLIAAARSPLTTDAAGGASLAELRQQQSSEDAAANGEAEKLVQQARDLATAGKPGVARIYYRMALGRANGELKQQILTAMAELTDSSSDKKTATTGRAHW